jgi:hypothetical protein
MGPVGSSGGVLPFLPAPGLGREAAQGSAGGALCGTYHAKSFERQCVDTQLKHVLMAKKVARA